MHKKKPIRRLPEIADYSLVIDGLDCSPRYIERFDLKSDDTEYVTLLNQRVRLDYSRSYLKSLKPLLRNNVLYFEYAIVLGALFKQTKEECYLNTFIDLYRKFIQADATPSSYIYSLHIPNILIALELFGSYLPNSYRAEILRELYSQYKYLKQNQEKHLLANHYFENLKALVIASYVFNELKECNCFIKKLQQQVVEQINEDGLHYELSSMYHKILLEDLLRIYKLSLNKDFPKISWIKTAIYKMTDAAIAFEDGFNRTPLFNDAGDNVAKPLEDIVNSVKSLIAYAPRHIENLKASGYYKLKAKNIVMNIDAGVPGPDYQPGHVHNDCLSFELAFDKEPVFVNSGTLLYQGGERQYFRSAKAHNTVVVDNVEQSQCWGEHRVAKRLKILGVTCSNNLFVGAYQDFKGNIIRRRIHLEESGLSIRDKVIACENCPVSSFLHVADSYTAVFNGSEIEIKDMARVRPINATIKVHDQNELSSYAPEFGQLKQATCIEFSWRNDDTEHGYNIEFI